MINIKVDGSSLAAAQSQRVTIAGFTSDSNNVPSNSTAVGTSSVRVLDGSAASATGWSIIFYNISTAGQRIAFGFTSTITFATSGHILEPGDVWYPEFVKQTYWAIADSGGSALRIFAQVTT